MPTLLVWLLRQVGNAHPTVVLSDFIGAERS